MVEKITDKTLYHVTVAKPHKQPLTAGQALRVGDAFNPFFGFYEGSREYPVSQGDGSLLQIKAVAFLRQVRDGKINCPNLGAIATEVAQHYVMLARELLMEEIRLKGFSDAPSRQTCLYLCATADEAQYWNQRIGDNGQVCSLRCTGVTHRADARLLLGDSEPLSVTRDRAQRYWRGDAGDNPEWETLFAGDAVVVDVGVRND